MIEHFIAGFTYSTKFFILEDQWVLQFYKFNGKKSYYDTYAIKNGQLNPVKLKLEILDTYCTGSRHLICTNKNGKRFYVTKNFNHKKEWEDGKEYLKHPEPKIFNTKIAKYTNSQSVQFLTLINISTNKRKAFEMEYEKTFLSYDENTILIINKNKITIIDNPVV